MANPQLANGHTDIAHELVEAFAQLYLSASESRVLWAVLRKSYGWHKKRDRISFTQFEQLTKMNRRHISDALTSLRNRQIVTRTGNGYKLEYGLNKNYEEWNLLPIEAINKVRHLNLLPIEATNKIVTHIGNTPLPIEATKSLPIEANTKEKKETIQKLSSSTETTTFEFLISLSKNLLPQPSKRIKSELTEYPEEWLPLAVDEAVKKYEQPHWGQVRGILNNWQSSGKPTLRSKARPNDRKGPAPDKLLEDPDKYIKGKYGHMVRR